jgi:hypothetical protein
VTRNVTISVGMTAALVLSLLAASVGPVGAANTATSAAADQLVVGSQHDTAADFNDAQLTNLTVEGSGSDATVVLEKPETDGFEDGDLSEYTAYGTDTSDWSTSTTRAKSGSVSGSFNADNSKTHEYLERGTSTAETVTVRGWVYAQKWVGLRVASTDAGTSGASLQLNPNDDTLRLRDHATTTNYDATANVSADTWYYTAIRYNRTTDEATVWIDDDTNFEDNPIAKRSATITDFGSSNDGYGLWTIDQNSDTRYWDDVTYVQGDGAPSSGTYSSPLHNVSHAEEAAINITQASNVSIDATVQTDGGATLATDTFSSTGNHTLNLSETSSSELETVLDIDVTGENPEFQLADESILFTNHAPEADNLSPPDGTELTQSSVDFSVDVSDSEFGSAQGESVTAELFVDGSSVGTETVTSNQTVTISHELTQGGDHTYHWELSDSYGATTTTSTKTITVPAELEVWDVNNDTLIDSGNATVTFFGGDNEQEIVEREVTNGTVSLAGLPTDTEFTVAVRADGYFTRQVIITSLFEQSRVWMLSKSVPDAVEVTFRLDDRTGEFANSDETQLRVQRPITVNNSTEWRDVIGDDISATSDLATVLQNDQRYRLIIENDMQSRILGSYTPSGPADPEVIPIGRVNFQADAEAGTALDASLLNETSPAVRVMFRDPDEQATSLKYRITNTTDGANSTVVVANTTVSNPGAFTSVTEVLPSGTTLEDSTYLVELWAYQDGELMEKQSVSVGQLSGPGDWTAGVNEGLLNLAGFVLIVSTGYGTANYKPELGALVAVIFGGALTLLNVVAIPHVILGFTGTIALIVNTADTT